MSRVHAGFKHMNENYHYPANGVFNKENQQEVAQKFREWLTTKGMSFASYKRKAQAVRTRIREEFTAETGYGRELLVNMQWIRSRRAHGHTPATDEMEKVSIIL